MLLWARTCRACEQCRAFRLRDEASIVGMASSRESVSLSSRESGARRHRGDGNAGRGEDGRNEEVDIVCEEKGMRIQLAAAMCELDNEAPRFTHVCVIKRLSQRD